MYNNYTSSFRCMWKHSLLQGQKLSRPCLISLYKSTVGMNVLFILHMDIPQGMKVFLNATLFLTNYFCKENDCSAKESLSPAWEMISSSVDLFLEFWNLKMKGYTPANAGFILVYQVSFSFNVHCWGSWYILAIKHKGCVLAYLFLNLF